ncbi:acyl-homoserine lactone acylase PvdQ [Bradyrhizobium diazoefficiens]|jgi:hypothetical protein|uniref:Bsl5243 protein n=3 Tax=Bradyrhizobium diazoefficiens TaxID=1355477 RepID=Q89JP0_BRADU|nr:MULTISPECIES: hypothetical protein [Bradyrhizobium]AND90435.1 hypothetical protein AAV28_23585 [Bradyrhizobium diazoefficiens USDA 110]APO52642.1 hypothetical protein BD122_20275 [Bradyrhizobium diazoefficiens]KGJ70803.1 hypothetical protein BJA5080_06554 [Bradyrhizobium diazoefficiens SEMIA 5080]KOY08592.1 hypothetical protein AF336_18855 [Bradyrhizobium diazoefficiens]MBR0864699.1 hypothetical protein [Bradyrhizobium diazoefficiens]
MGFTVVPRGRKPKPPIPLHRFVRSACRDIERITSMALTCAPTDSWSQTFFTNLIRALRNAGDVLERAVELRVAEDRAVHQEKLAAIRERETDARLHK